MASTHNKPGQGSSPQRERLDRRRTMKDPAHPLTGDASRLPTRRANLRGDRHRRALREQIDTATLVRRQRLVHLRLVLYLLQDRLRRRNRPIRVEIAHLLRGNDVMELQLVVREA